MDHVGARRIIIAAFKQKMGRDPSLAEAQLAQAVGAIESSYGMGWKGSGKGSNNWGAIQTKGQGFSYTDSRPTSTGQKKYNVNFKQYGSAVDGAADMIGTIFNSSQKQGRLDKDQLPTGPAIGPETRGQLTLRAAENGDLTAFSAAMYYTSYYQGFGFPFVKRIKNHAQSLDKVISNIASALNETKAVKLTDNWLPVTNDKAYIEELKKLAKGISVTDETSAKPITESNNLQKAYNDLLAKIAYFK
jgi:hypothetical protein